MENLNEMARIDFRGQVFQTKNDLVRHLRDQGYNASRAFQYVQEYAPNSGITRGSIASMYSRLASQERAVALGLDVGEQAPHEAQVAAPEAEIQQPSANVQAEPEVVPEVPQNAPQQDPDNNDDDDEEAPVPAQASRQEPARRVEIPAWVSEPGITELDVQAYQNAVNALEHTGWVKVTQPGISANNVELYIHNNFFAVTALFAGKTAHIRHIESLRMPYIDSAINTLQDNRQQAFREYYSSLITEISNKIVSTNDRAERNNFSIMLFRASIRFKDGEFVSGNLPFPDIPNLRFLKTVVGLAAITPYTEIDRLSDELSNFYVTTNNVRSNYNHTRHTDNIITMIHNVNNHDRHIVASRSTFIKTVKTVSAKILKALSRYESSASIFYCKNEALNHLDNTYAFLNNNIPDTSNNYGHLNADTLSHFDNLSDNDIITCFIRVRSFNYALFIFRFRANADAIVMAPILSKEIKEFIKKLISPDQAEVFFQQHQTSQIPMQEGSHQVTNAVNDFIQNYIINAYEMVRQQD